MTVVQEPFVKENVKIQLIKLKTSNMNNDVIIEIAMIK